MWYLFFQIWVWLLAAFILGWFAHWFFCCRSSGQPETGNTANIDTPANAEDHSNPEQSTAALASNAKPLRFSGQLSEADDLKRIKGVGAVLEKTLNQLGVFQFKQIAAWSPENVSWVNNSLSFSGRIERENWIEQAETLAKGGTTDFAEKVDKGGVNY